MKKIICFLLITASSAFSQNWDAKKWLQLSDSAILAGDRYLPDSTMLVRWMDNMTCSDIHSLRSRIIDERDSLQRIVRRTKNNKLQKMMWDQDGNVRYFYQKLGNDPNEDDLMRWYNAVSSYQIELETRFPTW